MKTLQDLLDTIEQIKEHNENCRKLGNEYFECAHYEIKDVPANVVVEASAYFKKDYNRSDDKLFLIPISGTEWTAPHIAIWSVPVKITVTFE